MEEVQRSPLTGKRIGFTGRLLSCDRRLARELVQSVGGHVARGPALDYLVLGNGGRPAVEAAGRTLTEAQFLNLVCAVTTDTQEHGGRIRKYFYITEVGQQRIDAFLDEWDEVKRIYAFIEGEKV